MTREGFLSQLRAGLRGMAPAAVDDIMADYGSHFSEGAAAGRSDEDIARALGDPDRLARELRAEAGLKRWEERRNPTAAAGAVIAVLGLATVDLLVLLPVLLAVAAVLFVLSMAVIGVFVGGVVLVGAGVAGQTYGLQPVQIGAVGFGLIAGAVGAGALLLLAVIGLINLIVRYGRLHYQLLQPSDR